MKPATHDPYEVPYLDVFSSLSLLPKNLFMCLSFWCCLQCYCISKSRNKIVRYELLLYSIHELYFTKYIHLQYLLQGDKYGGTKMFNRRQSLIILTYFRRLFLSPTNKNGKLNYSWSETGISETLLPTLPYRSMRNCLYGNALTLKLHTW